MAMKMEHTHKQFDAELERIRTGVLTMGGLVENQIVRAMEGLKNGNLELLEEVILQDRDVNRMNVELDDACGHIIALRQPAAVDLRLVMTVMRTVADLERIGDEAKKIAKAARRLHSGSVPYRGQVDLSHTAEVAVSMLRQALDSFARADSSGAESIGKQDDEVDAAFKATMRQLITFMMEDPRTISTSLEVLFVAKAIERIGDHAKNISEYVVFMTQGIDVRYPKSADTEGQPGA
ncbi:MAG: phosphate signaling complex protein PhoU [Thauera phenolivorans]|uniref:Phosphate-specific transport system accessory protein PhoU n=2 Tax=Thauera phenolivorans TaxID=1792543 RepID=A0A7X7LT63_9RHOO|nr:phosphate signaling complex protein PhoU [Thauera phenolivorans]